MRLIIIIALAIFWIVLAIAAFSRGEAKAGGVFIAIGVVLTGMRLMRLRR